MAHPAAQTAPAAAAAEMPKAPNWARLGVAFGIVSALSIILWGPIGVSGTYPRFIGELARLFDPSFATSNPYLVKMGEFFKPETFLVLGLPIGGLIASRVTGSKAPACEYVHASERTTGRRYWDAFLGGFLILFGARLAGGCTSGHIISGITQLAVSSMIFGAAVFASGIFTAKMIRKGA
jgi:uncharacterized membrane protein YedE/YeeE